MAFIDEIRSARLSKLNFLLEKGIDPYPAETHRDISCKNASAQFEKLVKDGKSLYIVGRIMSVRSQGKISFLDIFDGTGRFQALLKKGEPLSEESYELFEKAFDIGDFIEIKGTFFSTKKEEKTVLAEEIRMLSKSLRPLPEKWHGLQDYETRFRQRYLDLLLNSEAKEIFKLKEKFWKVTRDFLMKEGFMEVETPTLELTTGGAEARPFKTHHNDFDLDMFLRISVGELWQKRLMAAGFEKTFEIGRVYRNEGSSLEHVQEFTNVEFYASYMNFADGKELVKKLYQTIAKEVFNKTKFETRGHKFDLAGEWKEIDYLKTIKEMTGVNVLKDSEKTLKSKLEELNIKHVGENRERLADSLWKYCRKSISGPAFLTNHPKLVAPLSKEHPEDKDLTKTFQIIIAGSEIGRAHAELNNPVDQKERFDKQKELMEKGDEEAMMADDEFVEMLEHGMPPTFGFGFGERLFAFLMDKSTREVQLFPLMKPKD
jgi:lysyl-tRNA synthetase, class II